MTTPSAAVIDALNSLLEAEVNSIFHFVGAGSPYLSHATPAVRQPLEMMRQHLDQHELDLSHLIRRLGGEASIPPKPNPDDQYLSYLSLKFLLPKLVDAKELMIRRYENVMETVAGTSEVLPTLKSHLDEMQRDLVILQQTAADVAGHR